MHFSIPDTQEFINETTGSTYTGYNIYINGSYHCCLRYKQLYSLHEQVRRHIKYLESPLGDSFTLPVFPSRKLLPLTISQVEQRRAALERYLQLIGQVPALARLELFQAFLLNAQQESAVALAKANGHELPMECCVDVLLMNGYQIQLECRRNDNASTLLRKACQYINLPPDFVHFFCIYLIRKDVENTLVLLRRLMDFEAPVISRQQAAASSCQLMLRKSYWNPAYDFQLMRDNVGLNLLFIQTVSDVEREWIITTPEIRKQLRMLQEQCKKREYMDLARKLPLYGCLQFMASSVDYPSEEAMSSALIAIGNRELSIRTSKGAKIYETKFRVTCMRCWRVTAVHQKNADNHDSPTSSLNLQLSFEYLLSRQKLRWITITSTQAMLMSVCLQSMVDELLQQKEAAAEHSPVPLLAQHNLLPSSPLSYVLRDGSGSQTICAASYSPNKFIYSSYSPSTQRNLFAQRRRVKPRNAPSPSSANPILSAYSSSSPTVFFRNAQESLHNEAFEGIGDDDL